MINPLKKFIIYAFYNQFNALMKFRLILNKGINLCLMRVLSVFTLFNTLFPYLD